MPRPHPIADVDTYAAESDADRSSARMLMADHGLSGAIVATEGRQYANDATIVLDTKGRPILTVLGEEGDPGGLRRAHALVTILTRFEAAIPSEDA